MRETILTKGNITTFATWIAIGITALLTYLGYELDYTVLIPLVSGVITFVIAIYSSKHPNTLGFLGNNHQTITVNCDDETAANLALAFKELLESYPNDGLIEVEVDEDGN